MTRGSGNGNVNSYNKLRQMSAGDLTIHSPDLDLPVVSTRHDERHAGVKGSPVDPPVVTLDTKIHKLCHTDCIEN